MVNFVRGGTRIYAAVEGKKSGLEGGPQAAQGGLPSDNYLSALLKLIPTEVVSIYMAVRDSAAQHDSAPLWFILCLVACLVLRTYSNLPLKTGSKIWDVQWRSVAVSVVAFFLWAQAIGSTKPLLPMVPLLSLDQWLASALAALFGILGPLLVPADAGDGSSSG
jgi:hypothetical protein